MIVRIVILFLIGMVILAMFGRLRIPGADAARRLGGGRKCPKCGRHRIGRVPCECGHE